MKYSNTIAIIICGLSLFFYPAQAGPARRVERIKDLKPVQAEAPIQFVLGSKDNSDAEFAQSDFQLDFFPTTQSIKECPKELNTTWFPALYLHFPLRQMDANQGLTLHLDPAWNDGTGTLRVAMDAWVGSDWQEVGSTLLNMTEAGYVDVPPVFLRVGTNDLRLRSVSGTGGTTTVTWDQIKIETMPYSPVWSLGNNDGSAQEFSQRDFALVYRVGIDPISKFPKEVNTTWYPNQYLHFDLSGEQAQKGALLSFDVIWNNGAGALTVAVERWDGSNWTKIGSTALNSSKPGQIIIPAYHLKENKNEWRLTAVTGTGNTTVVVWDQISLLQRQALPTAVQLLLEEILDTTLNYFLSPRVVTEMGLPPTALKALEPTRFAYSNPTEWGYALQAWIVAAERGLLTPLQACTKIDRALLTMQRLQNNPAQFKRGLFYPFYKHTDREGKGLMTPSHDGYPELPIGDCALLWGSLNVTEGWLREQGFFSAAARAEQVKAKLNFRDGYRTEEGRHYLSMTVHADTGEKNQFTWLYWADEGGPVNMISYLARSTTWEEFQAILNTQERPSRSWKGHVTRESAYFNAMFTWGQRSLLGFPMLGNAKERAYGIHSFLPNVAAHLDYGDELRVDYPGFSDAMTQAHEKKALVARFTPPNIENEFSNDPKIPFHITPHALAIPFCALDVLDEDTLRRLFEKWVLLKCDTSAVWHPAYSQDPFGFEVIASPYLNHIDYPGADDRRYNFETLSQAYTALSIYEGLQRYDRRRTFNYFARRVPGFAEKVAEILNYAYLQD